MRQDFTDITMVIDRSGSMESIKAEAEGGINSFIEEQKKQPGEAVFSLCQFDTEYEFVHKGIPIKDVPRFHLVPRGWTALLDAVGRSIAETGERLSKMEESQRPGLVVFVIVTDGAENSSKEFTKQKIKEMIETQQNQWKWQFTFLGANQDAFAEAGALGIKTSGIANYADAGCAFAGAAKNVSRMRGAVASGLVPDNAYTEEEREAMSKPKSSSK